MPMHKLNPSLGALALLACQPSSSADGICDEDDICPTSTGASGIETVDEAPRLDLPGDPTGAPQSCEELALVATTAGCVFWAVDLPNAWHPGNEGSLDIASEQQFAVVVANTTTAGSARVAVYLGGTRVADADVGVGQVYTFDLPAQDVDPTRNGVAWAYRVESDRPITAYQFQPLDNNRAVYSNDATSLLPEHVLTGDYMAITGDAIAVSMHPNGGSEQLFNAGAFVTAVATEDDTTVNFYPTAGIYPQPHTAIRLDRGGAYTILSDLANIDGSVTGDLSGTRILADRPIAVFGGSVTAVVPVETSACCADHLEHQILPLSAWGNHYVAAPPPSPRALSGPSRALYRVTAAFDGTQFEWPGGRPDGAPVALAAAETAVFVTNEAFEVISVDLSKSFAVTQFLASNEAAGVDTDALGDPAMVALPAVAQFQPAYTFLVPGGYLVNAVVVVAPVGAGVHLDSKVVTLSSMIGGGSYEYGTIEIGEGAHTLTADAPIGVTVIGYDEFVSYAYSGGSGVAAISELPPVP